MSGGWGDWLDADEAARLQRAQAEALAKQLGHRMTDWLLKDRVWRARCNDCREVAVVHPRSFTSSPLSGGAVTFRCLKKR